jgi:PKD repeat protein
MNDLWRYQPDSACVYCAIQHFPIPNFFASDAAVCEKFCINFFDSSSNNPTSWQWSFPGASPLTSSDQNPTDICYNDPGTYDVTLITTNSYGSDTLTLNDYITVYATPSIPIIAQNGYTLTSSAAEFYQWQLNATDIPGATNQSYEVLQTGFYTVEVSDSNGCVNSATLYVQITGVEELTIENISVYPNPSSGKIIVDLTGSKNIGSISIQIINTLGQKVFSLQEKISSCDLNKEIILSDITPGVYIMDIKTENNYVRRKITFTN